MNQFVKLDGRFFRILRLFRLTRIFKLGRDSESLKLFIKALTAVKSELKFTLFLSILTILFSASAIYYLENEAQPEKFSSITESIWWATVSLATVGYGDVSPLTPLGKIIGAVTAIMGVCVVALLTGIVANAFANQVARRKAILEAEVANALLDGEISDQEQEKIESLRKRFDLSEDHVEANKRDKIMHRTASFEIVGRHVKLGTSPHSHRNM